MLLSLLGLAVCKYAYRLFVFMPKLAEMFQPLDSSISIKRPIWRGQAVTVPIMQQLRISWYGVSQALGPMKLSEVALISSSVEEET